jgi:alpha-beta hydrolase superfamily lysophospholipase
VTDRERVSFKSGTVNLRSYLYLPGGSELRPVPCVVLAHGFSGTMDRLTEHATHFADGGIAALIFDYRNFGESEGEPRQLVEIAGQQQDIRSAVDCVRSRPEIDPGPGELAVAAGEDADRMKEFLSVGNLNTLWKNEVAPRALLPMARFKPSTFAPRVQAPVLVCAAEHDLAPLETVRPLANLAPRGELRVFPGTHFDYYLDAEFRSRVREEQLAFLQHHLVAVA